jgi:hypothetical protein
MVGNVDSPAFGFAVRAALTLMAAAADMVEASRSSKKLILRASQGDCAVRSARARPRLATPATQSRELNGIVSRSSIAKSENKNLRHNRE